MLNTILPVIGVDDVVRGRRRGHAGGTEVLSEVGHVEWSLFQRFETAAAIDHRPACRLLALNSTVWYSPLPFRFVSWLTTGSARLTGLRLKAWKFGPSSAVAEGAIGARIPQRDRHVVGVVGTVDVDAHPEVVDLPIDVASLEAQAGEELVLDPRRHLVGEGVLQVGIERRAAGHRRATADDSLFFAGIVDAVAPARRAHRQVGAVGPRVAPVVVLAVRVDVVRDVRARIPDSTWRSWP